MSPVENSNATRSRTSTMLNGTCIRGRSVVQIAITKVNDPPIKTRSIGCIMNTGALEDSSSCPIEASGDFNDMQQIS